MVLWHNHHDSQTCIKWWPIGNGSVTANYQLITQYRFHRRGVTQKNNKKVPFSAVIDHLMYELLLNNTGNFDFGRETRIKLYLKDYS